MSIECDVLVVGAGPAGSCAARAAAINGAETIFIDKKDEIGIPVQCAEGIGKYLFPYLPFKIPDEQLIWQMDGIYFQVEDIGIEKKGDFWKSYSVNRNKFDKWIAQLAINEGANLQTNTELIDLKFDNKNNVKKAVAKRNDKTVTINPKSLIAADGCESTVLQLLGLYEPKQGDLADVYSWEMRNLDLNKPELEQIYTGEFTPAGYAYIFPKSKRTANIGVGGIYPEKKMEAYFEEFLEQPRVRKQVKNADYIIEKSKKAVWNDISTKWIYNNILLAGDVANQNLKPFIEGIIPSIICGDIAGKMVSKKKSFSNEDYKKSVESIMSPCFSAASKIHKIIDYIYRKKEKKKYLLFFSLVTDLFNENEFEHLEQMKHNELKEIIMRRINEI
jgi:digeranylgeranylglycerophospholipid reductase